MTLDLLVYLFCVNVVVDLIELAGILLVIAAYQHWKQRSGK